MAVLDGLSVDLVVDGKVAKEYDNDEAEVECDALRNLTTYVEAVSEKEFHLAFQASDLVEWGKADVIVARLKIDGKHYHGTCLRLEEMNRRLTLEGEWSGSGHSATLHKYAFAKLETSTCFQTPLLLC